MESLTSISFIIFSVIMLSWVIYLGWLSIAMILDTYNGLK